MKVYWGGYGHHSSGRQYAYIGGDNHRTGQNVVVPVKGKSGAIYDTMLTITRTSGSRLADNEINRLRQRGIYLRAIKGTDVMNDLPTGRLLKNHGESAAGWARASQETYNNKIAMRLGKYDNGEKSQMTQKATSRLLGGVI